MTSIHYRPGDQQRQGGGWLAAVHESIALLVEIPGSASDARARLDALWRGLTAADGIQATLDELTRDGLSATPSFALVTWEDGSESGRLRAVIRGAVTLLTHSETGTSTTDAQDVSTWLEQQYPGVTSFELTVGSASETATDGGDDDAALLALQSGEAWAAKLVVGRTVTTPVATSSVKARGGAASAAPPPTVAPVAVPAPQVVTPTEWIDPEATVSGLTSIPEAVPAPKGADPEPSSEGSYDYLFGETVFRSVEDAAVRDESEDASDTPAADSGSAVADNVETADGAMADDGAEAGDHDGHTIASVDIAKLRAGRKARGATTPPAPAPRLYLETADGSREQLNQPVLVGRAPSVSKVSGGQMPKLLTFVGSDQDISRNHAQFAVEGGTVVVTDLHSRNGTMIILPGRSPQQLRQGEPTSVIVGTVVDLGGGVTFTVGEE